MPLIERDFSTDKERHPLPIIPTIPLPVIPAAPLPVIPATPFPVIPAIPLTVIPAVFSGNPVETILIPSSIRESYPFNKASMTSES